MRGRRRWGGMVFLLLLAGLPLERAEAAPFCTGDWAYTVESLQEARRRLKSPVHKQVSARVACGHSILDGLDADGPTAACPACATEYVQFLRDYIVFLRRAAEWTASKGNRETYYRTEIAARQRLGEFLAEDDGQTLAAAYWSDNFEGLGDAMERVGDGQQYHDEALAASMVHVLSDKAFKTWARAIRSCESWDFAVGRNRDQDGLNKVLLCVNQCRMALTKIRKRVDEGRAVDKVLTTEILDGLLPALRDCPVQDGS